MPLQPSFTLEEIVGAVASAYDVRSERVWTCQGTDPEARRLAMHCVSQYCRHQCSLTELAQAFGVSPSALGQAKLCSAGEPIPRSNQYCAPGIPARSCLAKLG